MNIFYDENMPFAKEFFGNIQGTNTALTPFNGRTLTAEQVSDADVLLVRSITQVNEQLLCKNKQLAFVGTATIGVDHIDQLYLNSRDIPFYSAPGCNAVSVAEYVLSSLLHLAKKYQFNLSDKTVGIVGAGNTGSRLSEKLTALNINHVLCDPILEQSDDSRSFVSLDQALACDIISLHVPKTMTGCYATYHMLDEQRLSNLQDEQILINACRGEVIDNQALLSLKQQGMQTRLVLDVWENEPNVLMPLIEYAEIATAHIAGYSLEGKARGTEMLYQSLCEQLNLTPSISLSTLLPKPVIEQVSIHQDFNENILTQLSKMVYDVMRDDEIFRQQISEQGFDYIRKTYPARREFSSLQIECLANAKSNGCYGVGFSQVK